MSSVTRARAVSLAFPDRHFSGFERLKTVADLPYLLFDVLGTRLKIEGAWLTCLKSLRISLRPKNIETIST
jgi:hypothetical protein